MIQFIKKYWLLILLGIVVIVGAWGAGSDLSSIRKHCYEIGNTAEQCEMT